MNGHHTGAWSEVIRHTDTGADAGDQPRPGRHQGQAKAFGNLIAKPGSTHLGNGLSARRHHQTFSDKYPLVGGQLKARPASHRTDSAAQPQLGPSLGHIAGQHRDNLASTAITKQLPQGFFVPGNPRPIQTRDEIRRGEPAERGKCKARVLRQEPFGGGRKIGEIAAPTARNANFFARGGGVIQQQNPPSAPRRLGSADHPGGPGTQNYDIPSLHSPR